MHANKDIKKEDPLPGAVLLTLFYSDFLFIYLGGGERQRTIGRSQLPPTMWVPGLTRVIRLGNRAPTC